MQDSEIIETVLNAEQKNVRYRVAVEDIEKRKLKVGDCHFGNLRKIVSLLGEATIEMPLCCVQRVWQGMGTTSALRNVACVSTLEIVKESISLRDRVREMNSRLQVINNVRILESRERIDLRIFLYLQTIYPAPSILSKPTLC